MFGGGLKKKRRKGVSNARLKNSRKGTLKRKRKTRVVGKRVSGKDNGPGRKHGPHCAERDPGELSRKEGRGIPPQKRLSTSQKRERSQGISTKKKGGGVQKNP